MTILAKRGYLSENVDGTWTLEVQLSGVLAVVQLLDMAPHNISPIEISPKRAPDASISDMGNAFKEANAVNQKIGETGKIFKTPADMAAYYRANPELKRDFIVGLREQEKAREHQGQINAFNKDLQEKLGVETFKNGETFERESKFVDNQLVTEGELTQARANLEAGKPPAQRVEVAGVDMAGFSEPAGNQMAYQVKALAANPQFQAFAIERAREDPSKVEDSAKYALIAICNYCQAGSPGDFQAPAVVTRFVELRRAFEATITPSVKT